MIAFGDPKKPVCPLRAHIHTCSLECCAGLAKSCKGHAKHFTRLRDEVFRVSEIQLVMRVFGVGGFHAQCEGSRVSWAFRFEGFGLAFSHSWVVQD